MREEEYEEYSDRGTLRKGIPCRRNSTYKGKNIKTRGVLGESLAVQDDWGVARDKARKVGKTSSHEWPLF